MLAHQAFQLSGLLLSACLISPQLVFMLWNAFNDPLFGYLQDTSKMRCCSQRRLSILYGAPLYSLTFLLPWFPWRSYYPGDWLSGLHLMVALCAFDGLLTFVLLAQCALFAEISNNHQNRLRLVQYSQVPVQILQMPRRSASGSLICLCFIPGSLSYRLLQHPLLWCCVTKHGGLCSFSGLLGAGRGAELRLHALHGLLQPKPLR